MGDNMIAICLYFGIFLMAGTVLVLTVIYFVKPASTKKGTVSISDVKQNTEKKPDKIRVKRTKSIRKVMPTIKMPTIKMPAITIKQIKKTKKEVSPIVEAEKTDSKKVIPATRFIEAHPVEIDKTPKMAAGVKLEKDINTNIVSQSIAPKSENQEQPLLKETPKSEVIASPPSSPKPALENIKPMPDGNSQSSNVSEKTIVVEAVKKEPEPKMDNKNVNTPPNSPVEKPPLMTVKPATPATNVIVNKKAPEQKTSLNELSQMFSKEAVEDSEATKLAKNMKDVEIDNLIKDGQDLINLLKRGRS